MDQYEKEQIAIWRFSIISPVVHGIHQCANPTEYFKKASLTPLKNPVTKETKVYSSRTLAYWYYQYLKLGLDGLMPGDRKDHGCFRALNLKSQDRIEQILEEFPRIPNTKLRDRLKKEGIIDDSLSQSTIDRFVRVIRPEKKLPDIHLNKDRKAFEFETVNQCWQADTTFLNELGGRKVCLMLIIDDASRMVVGYGFFHQDNAVNFLRVLKKAISIYGRPQMLYMDNGAPYANHQLDMICAEAGITVAHTPVRDGAAKGKIERLNRTLKEGWLSQVDWKSFLDLTQIENSFNDYLYPEYINKPHSALVKSDGTLMTPRERYLLDQNLIKRVSVSELDRIFVCRYERKVKTNSTISINRTVYEVPAEFMKETVSVFIDPLDEKQAWIEDKVRHKRIEIKKLNKAENVHIPRKRAINYPRRED